MSLSRAWFSPLLNFVLLFSKTLLSQSDCIDVMERLAVRYQVIRSIWPHLPSPVLSDITRMLQRSRRQKVSSVWPYYLQKPEQTALRHGRAFQTLMTLLLLLTLLPAAELSNCWLNWLMNPVNLAKSPDAAWLWLKKSCSGVITRHMIETVQSNFWS